MGFRNAGILIGHTITATDFICISRAVDAEIYQRAVRAIDQIAGAWCPGGYSPQSVSHAEIRVGNIIATTNRVEYCRTWIR